MFPVYTCPSKIEMQREGVAVFTVNGLDQNGYDLRKMMERMFKDGVLIVRVP